MIAQPRARCHPPSGLAPGCPAERCSLPPLQRSVPDSLLIYNGAMIAEPVSSIRITLLWDQDFPALVLANHLEKKGFLVQLISKTADLAPLLSQPGVLLVDEKQAEEVLAQPGSGNQWPVMVLVSPRKPAFIHHCLERGARDFIVKPVDLHLAEARISLQVALMTTSQALAVSQQRYELALEGSSDGIWDWDIQKGTVFYSPRWKWMLGFRDEELGSALEDWLDRIHPEDIQRVQNALDDCMRGGSFLLSEEYRLQHRDGQYRWFLARGIIRNDEQGQPKRMVGAQTDLTYRGAHDEMTGLPKRNLFLESLSHALGRSRSGQNPLLAVLELSLDRFSTITTTYGDYIGDQVILKFVDIVRAELLPGSLFARLDGANFVVALDGLQKQAQAADFARSLIRATTATLELFEQRIRLQLSIGIALHAGEPCSPENLLRHAHAALIHAKRKPHGGFELFQPAMQREVEENLVLENRLRTAVAKKELRLMYQPQVDAKSHKVLGVEALLRWNNQFLGEVGPSRFISAAESSGDIVQIGFWVMEQGIRQIQQWERKGLAPLRLAVNASGYQIKYPGLVEKIAAILEASSFPAQRLAIELTESVLMDQGGSTSEVLDQLNQLGVALEIDDFGTGYSSLSYLARFPVRALKIDRAFVTGLPDHSRNLAITRAIVHMGKALGLSLVAEGVETQEQSQTLTALGCDSLQGYLFAPPLESRKAFSILKDMGMAPAEEDRTIRMSPDPA